ncbi:unnamed protein product [Dracunculus medinensis]|uniref:Arrestin_C domain-containing protein n=1 Tax=Dracunculus medinensis TaxID=318479 RepID=A0A158Q5Y3_DRAME|nr:unnamed protein product [Dracunculus medinensis]
MDCIKNFDIHLEKDIYCSGELINGTAIIENGNDIKVTGIIILLRGKAHAELKITKSGERRTLKDDHYILDEKILVWGKEYYDGSSTTSVLASGLYKFPFVFQLPQCSLPCSLETKLGTIRYYIKVIVDTPFVCSPQAMKYFTIIGPIIDCMESKYLKPLVAQDRKTVCCCWCRRGVLALRFKLERTAYMCGENIRAQALIENYQNSTVCINMKLIQHVEYFIDRGAIGENKSIDCTVFEYRSASVLPHSQGKYDSALEQPLYIPTVPSTLVGVCRLIQIFYIYKVCLEDEKGNESLQMEFPLTIGTLPYNDVKSSRHFIDYDYCSSHVEGGRYVSPEFRLGQVYDGRTLDEGNADDLILYRPVYSKIAYNHHSSSKFIDKNIAVNICN